MLWVAIDRGTLAPAYPYSSNISLRPYRHPPRREALFPLPAAREVVRGAGRDLRGDHAEGVEHGSEGVRAELREERCDGFGGADYAAGVLLARSEWGLMGAGALC